MHYTLCIIARFGPLPILEFMNAPAVQLVACHISYNAHDQRATLPAKCDRNKKGGSTRTYANVHGAKAYNKATTRRIFELWCIQLKRQQHLSNWNVGMAWRARAFARRIISKLLERIAANAKCCWSFDMQSRCDLLFAIWYCAAVRCRAVLYLPPPLPLKR